MKMWKSLWQILIRKAAHLSLGSGELKSDLSSKSWFKGCINLNVKAIHWIKPINFFNRKSMYFKVYYVLITMDL